MACYVLELFFNIIFLLFIWEFILYTHSHLLPIPSLVHPPKLVFPHQSPWNTKSYLHCPYTYCSMVKLPLTSPLMKTEVSSSHLPTPLPSHPRHQKPSTVKTYTAASLSQFLRSLPELLGWTFGGGGICHRVLQCLSQLWVCSHQHHWKERVLANSSQWQHGSRTSTQFLAATWITKVFREDSLENELFFISNILLLLRDRVIIHLGSVLGRGTMQAPGCCTPLCPWCPPLSWYPGHDHHVCSQQVVFSPQAGQVAATAAATAQCAAAGRDRLFHLLLLYYVTHCCHHISSSTCPHCHSVLPSFFPINFPFLFNMLEIYP